MDTPHEPGTAAAPLSFAIRPAIDEELARIAEVFNRAEPDEPPIDEGVVRWLLSRADPARPHPNLVAETDGNVVAWANLRGIPDVSAPLLILEVDPAYRRRGIGSALLESIISLAVGERAMWVAISAANEDGLEFAARHGFVEEHRVYESRLDLATWDPPIPESAQQSLIETGYRFSTLAEEDNPELRRAIHGLQTELIKDIPTPIDILPLTFEEWTRDWIDSPHAIPATFALALVGDELAGFSYVISQSEGVGYMWMTGVARDHRGKGVGLAVKSYALSASKAIGLREVLTNNDPDNAPMLAINRRLGFVNLPARVQMKKSLV